MDTCVLIEPWNGYYSMDRCSDYWDIIDELARNDIVFCSKEVRREISKIDDDLWAWVKVRDYLFKDADDKVQENLRMILDRFQRLVDTTRDRSAADPWVIAHAIAEKAVVVTKESFAPKKMKIPDVCRSLSVECIDDHELIAELGIHFSASLP